MTFCSFGRDSRNQWGVHVIAVTVKALGGLWSLHKFVGTEETSNLMLQFQFSLNVNNVLDQEYLSKLSDSNAVDSGNETYKGINTSNRGYFGMGRTWNLSVKYTF